LFELVESRWYYKHMENFEFYILSSTGIIAFFAYLFGGVVDAVCGGGGLITVPALMSLGMPAHMVVGTNHCSAIFGCFTSAHEYSVAGKIDKKAAFTALPFALVGALIGVKLNLVLDERYLQILMIFLVPALAIFSLVRKDVGEEDHSDEVVGRSRTIRCALIGLIVTIYHSFYGPASGVFFLLSFVNLLKFDAVKANGTTRLLLACINVLTAIAYFTSGNLCWKAVIVGTMGYIFGNYIGARIAIFKGARIIKPLYYCVMAGLMVKLLLDLV